MLSTPLLPLLAPCLPHAPPVHCPTPPAAAPRLQTIMAQEQPFFDATTKGDIVSRLTLDVQVLQATVAGARALPSLAAVCRHGGGRKHGMPSTKLCFPCAALGQLLSRLAPHPWPP